MNTTRELQQEYTTEAMLVLRYHSTEVHLSEICKYYLGISPKVAEEKAAKDDLPFETFRLGDRPPTFVKLSSLAKSIDKAAEKAWRDHENTLARLDRSMY